MVVINKYRSLRDDTDYRPEPQEKQSRHFAGAFFQVEVKYHLVARRFPTTP
jgi:hypothetical protein